MILCRQTKKRYTFKTGNFIRYPKWNAKDGQIFEEGPVQLGLIRAIFVHELVRGERRAFALVNKTKKTGRIIHSISSTVFITEPEFELIALPLIHTKRVYMIPVNPDKDGNFKLNVIKASDAPIPAAYIFVDWDIELL
jgi:hypothetical protein